MKKQAKNTNWSIPFYEDWQDIPLDVLRHIFNEAKTELTNTMQVQNRISDRAFWMISVMIPFIGASTTYLLTFDGASGRTFFLAIVTLFVGLVIFYYLFRLAMPHSFHRSGSFPNELMDEYHIKPPSTNSEHRTKWLLYCELHSLQNKIDSNYKETQLRMTRMGRVMITSGIYLAVVVAGVIASGLLAIPF